MSQLLEKAFLQASKLPKSQQDRLAQWIIDEVLIESSEWTVITKQGLAAAYSDNEPEYLISDIKQ
jgi:hypothetical protein